MATGSPVLAIAAPPVDYAIARSSRGVKTKPWARPWWHLRAELKLFARTVGRLARAPVTSGSACT